MDYHLRNQRTGETVPLSPNGTLIGTADHAAVRPADGPYLAALAVRYPGGWCVRGLSDDPDVRYNREPLPVGRAVAPQKGDLLEVGADRFAVMSPRAAGGPPHQEKPPPPCLAYVHDPFGTEECREVDHDLLIGRLPCCHVRFDDPRLSRASALIAAYDGAWFLHCLSKKPVGRNRERVDYLTRIGDGDELQIGPLVIRVEIGDRPARARPVASAHATGPAPGTDAGTDTVDPDSPEADLLALRASAMRLDHWLKDHAPDPAAGKSGKLGGWLGAARDRLRGFWLDTPETTAARGLVAAGRPAEALAVLDRSIRARPDSPGLLRELYRLHEAVGMHDLCYRPLRQIEKLAAARGRPDTWVLEALARLCGRLAADRPDMSERAVAYWKKLESLTGVSYAREQTAVLAARALKDGGFPGGR